MKFSLAAFTLCISLALLVCACGKTHEQAIGSVGETMAYDVTNFSVKVGQKVHLTLRNNGTSPAMVHNFVLVKPGTEAAVAQAGIAAGPTSNYVQIGDANVLAASPLAQPRETVEFTFTAPSKGTYPYLCTFPGHYQTMKGTLTVTD